MDPGDAGGGRGVRTRKGSGSGIRELARGGLVGFKVGGETGLRALRLVG